MILANWSHLFHHHCMCLLNCCKPRIFCRNCTFITFCKGVKFTNLKSFLIFFEILPLQVMQLKIQIFTKTKSLQTGVWEIYEIEYLKICWICKKAYCAWHHTTARSKACMKALATIFKKVLSIASQLHASIAVAHQMVCLEAVCMSS